MFVYVLIGYAAHDHGTIQGVWTFVNVDDARAKFKELEGIGQYDLVLARTILGQMLTPQGLAEILEVNDASASGVRTVDIAAQGPAQSLKSR